MSARRFGVLLALAGFLSAAEVSAADFGDVLAEAALRAAAEAAARVLVALVQASLEPSESPPPPLHDELDDWRDPGTRSTSRMAAGCGVVVQTLLTGNGREHFVELVVHNERAGGATVRVSSARFGDGTEASLRSPPLRVKSGGTGVEPQFFDAPALDPQHSIELVVDVSRHARTCQLRLRHERTSRAPAPVPAAEGEVWAGWGARFAAGGGLRALGRDGGVAYDFGAAWFPWEHHGLSADLLLDVGDVVDGTGLAAGYVTRFDLGRRLTLSYGASLGFISYALEDAEGREDRASVVALQQRLRAQIDLLPAVRWYVAPTVVHLLVTGGELGGFRLRGSSLAAVLSLGAVL